MLPNIRTSLDNKAVVAELTYKLQLGPENVIARLAFSYSIANSNNLDLSKVRDSKGKEYSMKVLFGNNNIPVYVALICQKYGLYKTNKDVGRLIKMHVDDGLERLHKDFKKNATSNSFDFFMNKIETGLSEID